MRNIFNKLKLILFDDDSHYTDNKIPSKLLQQIVTFLGFNKGTTRVVGKMNYIGCLLVHNSFILK